MNILIVEDSLELALQMKHYLEGYSFRVDHCLTGTEAMGQMRQRSYDLLILDLGLPDVTGLTVLRKARELAEEMKVIVVSAQTGAAEVAHAIDSGADDYLRKPVNLIELRSRIAAVTRRGRVQSTLDEYEHNGFVFTPSKSSLCYGDKQILLTETEQSIVQLLFDHQPDVVPATTFMKQIWGDFAGETDDNILHVYVNSVRKKARKLRGRAFIKTCRLQGYQLV